MQPVNERFHHLRNQTASPLTPGQPMSRTELAAAVNDWVAAHRGRECELDANYIGKLERGVIKWPQADYRAALRAILGAANDQELGFRPPQRAGHTPAETGTGPHAGMSVRATSENQQPSRPYSGRKPIEVLSFMPVLEAHLVPRIDDHEALIALLTQAAAGRGPRVVSVVGPGGFGKTTLTKQVAADQRTSELFELVLWIEPGPECSPARLVGLIADLNVHLEGTRPDFTDPEQAGFHLARAIGDRRALLVIDNAWSAADLAPLLIGAPNCVRLVTTRNHRVCPSATAVLPLEAMGLDEVTGLLRRYLPGSSPNQVSGLAEQCGGWPLLAAVVGANINQDYRAGATPAAAVEQATATLATAGPAAFDIATTDQRQTALSHIIQASLDALDRHVSISGATALADRYRSLAILAAATPIPISLLSAWWSTAYGWTEAAVRQFCRLLADRSLLSAYRADRDSIVLHDVFRDLLRDMLGDQWRQEHRSLIEAARPASGWTALATETDYLWRYLPYHLAEAGEFSELAEALADLTYVTGKVRRCGAWSLTDDHDQLTAARRRAPEDSPTWERAATITASGYLLQGIADEADMATTLQIALRRRGHQAAPLTGKDEFSAGAPHLDLLWTVEDGAGRDDAHTGAIVAVASSGDTLASGGEDGLVRTWHLPSRKLVTALRGHTGWVYALAFSPDGRTLASAGDDTTIRLHHLDTGTRDILVGGHDRRIRALAFDPETGQLLSGGDDGRICLWRPGQADPTAHMATSGTPVWSLTALPGNRVAAVGADEYTRVFNLATGTLVCEHARHRDWVRAITRGPEDTAVVTASSDGVINLWRTTTTGLELDYAAARVDDRLRTVASGPAGTIFAAGERARVYAIGTEEVAAHVDMGANVDWIRSLTVTDDSNVVVGCEDGALRSWKWSDTTGVSQIAAGTNTVWSAAFANAGSQIALGYGEGTIQLRDTATGVPIRDLSAGHGRIWSMAAHRHQLAAAAGDGSIAVFDLTDGAQLFEFNTDTDRSWACAMDGDLLAASDGRGQLRTWNLATGQQIWAQPAEAGRIRSLALNAEADLLVSAGGNGMVKLWDASTGRPRSTLDRLAGWPRTVTLDPARRHLAIGYGNGDIDLYDLETNQLITHLTGHAGRVLMLGFTSEEARLVSAAADGAACIWDTHTGRSLRHLRVDASAHCGAFSSEANAIILGSAAGSTMLSFTAPAKEEP